MTPAATPRRRLAPLWLISPVLLLLYLWTWTETVHLSIQVAGDRCTAFLYGRSSAIDCPGLAGGAVARYVADAAGRDPLTRLSVRLSPPYWQLIAPSAPLATAFSLEAALRRPLLPAGVVLSTLDGGGWVFIIDADGRRGAWWTWDGAPAVPLKGIPLDRPLTEQAKPVMRQLLAGWLGAAAIVMVVKLLAMVDRTRAAAGRRQGERPLAEWPFDRPASSSASPSTFSLQPSTVVRHRRTGVSSSVILLFAFAVSLHVATDVLESIPHVQDSVTYLFQAQTLARGDVTAPTPPLATAGATAHFEQEFLMVRDGRWFGKYPPGYPAVLALGVRAGAPWLVNPLLATVTVAMVFALARQVQRRGAESAKYAEEENIAFSLRPSRPSPLRVDFLAILLLATSPFFLVMSGSFMAHAAEIFCATLFMWAWAVAIGRRSVVSGRWPALAAGVALGMLALTRQFTALTIGLAFGVGLVVLAWRWWGKGARGRDGPKGASFERGLIVVLAALPFVLALPLYQAAVTGDPRLDPRLLYWPYDRVGFGPGVGESENAFTMTPTDAGPAIVWNTDPDQPPRGHSLSRGIYNLGRNLDALNDQLFGWPPWLALAGVWLAFLLRRPAATDWLWLVVALAVAGGYAAYWAAGIAYGPRYFYAALPALVILTARGFGALAEVGGRRTTAVVLLALLAYNLVRLPAYVESYRGYNFVSAAPRLAFEAEAQPPALVFVRGEADDWWHYGAFFSGNTPWLDGPFVYARDLGPDENARLATEFPDRRAYYVGLGDGG